MSPDLRPAQASPAWTTFVIVMIAGLTIALLLALWQAREAVLLAFAASVLAVVLLAVARPLERWLHLSRRVAVPLATLALLGAFLGATVSVGAQLAREVAVLAEALPTAIEKIEAQFGVRLEDIVRGAAGTGAKPGEAGNALPSLTEILGGAATALGSLASAGSLVGNALAGTLIVVVGAIYLALDPARHRRGLVLLFPSSQQPVAAEALVNSGIALGKWLRAQLIAMVAVGLLAGLGAWWIDLPAPLAIGIVAGLTEFIPVLGPWLGAVPALILAAGAGWQPLLWTGALFLAIQQLENSMITPLAQQQTTDIPPFLVLFGVITLGLVFGLPGVLVSGPLTLVAYVLVTELYVRDTLGHDVPVPGVDE
jgi:predicted PurR-regulated permease PerM